MKKTTAKTVRGVAWGRTWRENLEIVAAHALIKAVGVTHA